MDTLLTKEQKLSVLDSLRTGYAREKDVAEKALAEAGSKVDFILKVAAVAEFRWKAAGESVDAITRVLADVEAMITEVNAGKL